jgi:hypothetical protein
VARRRSARTGGEDAPLRLVSQPPADASREDDSCSPPQARAEDSKRPELARQVHEELVKVLADLLLADLIRYPPAKQ